MRNVPKFVLKGLIFHELLHISKLLKTNNRYHTKAFYYYENKYKYINETNKFYSYFLNEIRRNSYMRIKKMLNL